MDESAKTYISPNDDSLDSSSTNPPGAATSQNKAGATTTMAARKQMSSNASTNEPAKPLSAYGIFFRDIVSAIKKENPSCTFQELSRIASSMWEALDDAHRDTYNEKHEAARSEYIRQFKLYEQQQEKQQSQKLNEDDKHSNITKTVNLQSKPVVFTINQASTQEQSQQKIIITNKNSNITSTSTLQSKPAVFTIKQATTQQQQQPIIKTNVSDQPPASTVQLNNPSLVSTPTTSTDFSLFQENVLSVASAGLTDSNAAPTDTNATPTDSGAVQICIRNGCNKPAVISPDWEDEYCSNDCVVKHCRDVFDGWVLTNRTSKQ